MSKGKIRIFKAVAAVIFIFALLAGVGLFTAFAYARSNIDLRADEKMFERSLHWSTTTFYADDDKTDDVYTPIPIETSGSIRKIYYPADEMSRFIKEGFVAVEDRLFYKHKGVDIKRSMYAAINYIFGSEKTFGASTITQQVIKNISGDNDVSIKRKLSEMIRAYNIEQKYSKDEILEVYLNIVPMGDNIFGVGLASGTYFGKKPSKLEPHEAATLIGITNAPTAYSPYANPDNCLAKRNTVLSVMYDCGIITEEEYEYSKAMPLCVIPREERDDLYDSWFTETVIDDLSYDMAEKYGITPNAARIMLLGGGYSVYTTMDITAQRILEDFFENKNNFPEAVSDGLEFSMVISDTRSGDLAAIVGRVGEKRANRLLNHATQPHVPASCLKPIALYAPLIDEGRINWATVFDDVPTEFKFTDGEFVEYPKNSPAVYDGLTTVADALKKSKNTVAVRLYNIMGARKIYEGLSGRYGIKTLVEKREKNGSVITDLAPSPLALGQLSDGISLRKMTEAYSAFAGEGILRNMRSYIYVTDASGDTVIENAENSRRIYKTGTAQIINKLLMQVTDDGTARSVGLSKIVNTAGKTGTAAGSLEKMFIGYTPYYAAGIWSGYDKAKTALSSNAHLAVWDAVMTRLHREVIGGSVPHTFSDSELVVRPYCMDSGELYGDNCVYDVRASRLAYGYFTPDNAPHTLCTRHVLCYYDSVCKGIATDKCPKRNLTVVALLDIRDRSFPENIYVGDAEFVYNGLKNKAESKNSRRDREIGVGVKEEEYKGLTDRKRQFNRICPRHGKK